MKTILVKNSEGESIEVRKGPDGGIQIRHSDIGSRRFGDLHEISKRSRQSKAAEALRASGVDPESPESMEMFARLGGYMVIDGESHIISAEEIALILDAYRTAWGEPPNWSNRP